MHRSRAAFSFLRVVFPVVLSVAVPAATGFGLTACSPGAGGGSGSGGQGGGASGSGGVAGTGSGGSGSGGASATGNGGTAPGSGGSAASGSGGSASGSGGNPAPGGTGGSASGTGGSGTGGSSSSATGGSTGAMDAGGDPPAGACAAQAGGGSLLDPKTCLVWQKAATTSPLRTNKQAAKACAELTLDGFDDWRVPAPEELVTYPNLMASSNAYVTNPTYIPLAATEADGCTGNSHSCNIAEYNPGKPTCAWQGVGFAGPSVCVRGTARPGTTAAAFAASACDACKAHVGGAGADFKLANCLPYAN